MARRGEQPLSRRLAAAIEPFVGQVYFSPECHRGYEALGFAGSPFTTSAGVALPDGPAYFTSRGSLMGQVPGQVVAAAFAVFDPAVVVPAVTAGWGRTDAATIEAARTDGALGQLRRILGEEPEGVQRAAELLARATAPLRPEGKPLFAGLLACAVPEDPLGAAWRHADRLREHRGDAHTAAWTAAGFDAVEIGLLTELYWGLPLRSYIRTRGWSRADLEAAEERLRHRGLVEGDEKGRLTEAGRSAREQVEAMTDQQCQPALDALGSDLDELLSVVEPWSARIQSEGGYPAQGPHTLAAART